MNQKIKLKIKLQMHVLDVGRVGETQAMVALWWLRQTVGVEVHLPSQGIHC